MASVIEEKAPPVSKIFMKNTNSCKGDKICENVTFLQLVTVLKKKFRVLYENLKLDGELLISTGMASMCIRMFLHRSR